MAETAQSGSPAFKAAYLPFGSLASIQGTSPRTFGGKEEDGSGLAYFGARMYNARIGRFLGVDPKLSATESLFAIANNNPLRYGDENGKAARPLAIFFWAGNAGEFSDVIKQWITLNKGNYEVQMYKVYGRQEVETAIAKVNAQIEAGREVKRFTIADHYSKNKMLGMTEEEWKALTRIKTQPNAKRVCLIASCFSGDDQGLERLMAYTSGADSTYGILNNKFYGFDPNPKPGTPDYLAVLVAGVSTETKYDLLPEQIAELAYQNGIDFEPQELSLLRDSTWGRGLRIGTLRPREQAGEPFTRLEITPNKNNAVSYDVVITRLFPTPATEGDLHLIYPSPR
ncbi:MAG: RHS repeat-associated core domain-containing protein [Lentisphaerota bacterium]